MSCGNSTYSRINFISIVQINLHNCIAAMNELVLNAIEHQFDIALVQEPYNGTKWSMPARLIFSALIQTQSLQW